MKNQKLTVIALVVGILALTVGFAAFSNTLTINQTANVNPNNNLNVVFSKSRTTTNPGSVEATVSDTSSSRVAPTGGVATIDNDSMQTFSGLEANFTNPGQTVTYDLFIHNAGSIKAYLTNLKFNNIQNETVFRKCSAKTDGVAVADRATDTLVQRACNNIRVTVTVGYGEQDPIILTSSGSLQNKEILPEAGIPVRVVISYTGNNYVDGPMKVEFGDITLSASTTDSSANIQPSDSSMIGNEVSINGEPFYVIGTEGNNLKLISKYNLYAGYIQTVEYDENDDATSISNQTEINSAVIKQDSTAFGIDRGEEGVNRTVNWVGAINFANNNEYWYDDANSTFTETWQGQTHPYVYGNYSDNAIYPYMQRYKNYLESNGATISDIRLLSIEEYNSLSQLPFDFRDILSCSDFSSEEIEAKKSAISAMSTEAYNSYLTEWNLDNSSLSSYSEDDVACLFLTLDSTPQEKIEETKEGIAYYANLTIAPSFIYNTTYWFGSVSSGEHIYVLWGWARLLQEELPATFTYGAGIRPVVIVSESELD